MVIRRVIASIAAAALAASALALVGTSAQAEEVEPKKDDCLLVDKSEAWDSDGMFTIVPCEQSHNSEVYKVIPYPDDLGAPSTIVDQAAELFWESCGYQSLEEWLGASKFKMPLRVFDVFRLPTDEQWEAGARWVACSAVREAPNGSVMSYKGILPALLASTPLIGWVWCAKKTPKSGATNVSGPCTKKSEWLRVNGVGFRAKVGANYPKDVQAKADKLCAKIAKPLLKKGTKSTPIAALIPKDYLPPNQVFGECFIKVADWTGKAR